MSTNVSVQAEFDVYALRVEYLTEAVNIYKRHGDDDSARVFESSLPAAIRIREEYRHALLSGK